jgi:two-component system NarL family sensor kinase
MADKNVTTTEQLKKRNRELFILNRIAETLNHAVDLNHALESILRQVADLLGLGTGWIFMVDEETNKFYPAASLNLPPALAERPGRLRGTCYCLDTYLDGDLEGAANVNIITCSRLEDLAEESTHGLLYHASIPLYAQDKGKKLGVLNVATKDWRKLNEEELRLLYTIGDLLSITIERARLFQRSIKLGAVEERNRIAREIHDTLAQGLAGIALKLETADSLMDMNSSPDEVQTIVRHALDLTRANLEEARRSVMDLRAAPLEERNLIDAVQNLISKWNKQTDISFSFDIIGEVRPLPSRIETALYRVIQESLTNIGRHAEASRVEIRIGFTDNEIRLVIEDDGIGFDLEKLTEGHYGVIGMNERVKLLGGKLDLTSCPGFGTTVGVKVPLESKR